MKKLIMLAAACCMFALNACVNFKTEATVDVEVTQGGKPLSGITVYKFVDKGLGLGIANYKSNATGSAVTNGSGVAHFKLKSPDDFSPSSIAGKEEGSFCFATFDKYEDCIASVQVNVKTGDKKTIQLEIPVEE